MFFRCSSKDMQRPVFLRGTVRLYRIPHTYIGSPLSIIMSSEGATNARRCPQASRLFVSVYARLQASVQEVPASSYDCRRACVRASVYKRLQASSSIYKRPRVRLWFGYIFCTPLRRPQKFSLAVLKVQRQGNTPPVEIHRARSCLETHVFQWSCATFEASATLPSDNLLK